MQLTTSRSHLLPLRLCLGDPLASCSGTVQQAAQGRLVGTKAVISPSPETWATGPRAPSTGGASSHSHPLGDVGSSTPQMVWSCREAQREAGVSGAAPAACGSCTQTLARTLPACPHSVAPSSCKVSPTLEMRPVRLREGKQAVLAHTASWVRPGWP